MKYKSQRIVIQSEPFKEHYSILEKEGTYRIEEWIKGFEYTLARDPNYGDLFKEVKGIKIFWVGKIDINNKRDVFIYYAFDEKRVIFLDIKAGKKQP